jgi:hypothetical protein
MRRFLYSLLIVPIVFAFSLEAQHQPHKPGDPDDPVRLPNGKNQRDELLKLDHEKDVTDSRELARLAGELKEELEKGDAFVMSLGALKKTEEIEKLAKRIRGRIRRY